MHDVVVGVLPVWADPERDEDVVVVLPQLGDGSLPIETILVPSWLRSLGQSGSTIVAAFYYRKNIDLRASIEVSVSSQTLTIRSQYQQNTKVIQS